MMKSCSAMVSAAVARPRIVGVSLRSTKDDQQDEDDAETWIESSRMLRSVCERRRSSAGCHQSAHQRIAQHHADADECNEGERLQNQMKHDAVLQQHLGSPLAVDRGQLLLGLDAVVEMLSIWRSALRSLMPASFVVKIVGVGRRRSRIGLASSALCWAVSVAMSVLRLLQRLLDQLVAVRWLNHALLARPWFRAALQI